MPQRTHSSVAYGNLRWRRSVGLQLILPEAPSECLAILFPSRSQPCSPYRLPSFSSPRPSVPGGQGNARTGQLVGGETSHGESLWSSRVPLDPTAPITQILLHLQSWVRTHCPPCSASSCLLSRTPPTPRLCSSPTTQGWLWPDSTVWIGCPSALALGDGSLVGTEWGLWLSLTSWEPPFQPQYPHLGMGAMCRLPYRMEGQVKGKSVQRAALL